MILPGLFEQVNYNKFYSVRADDRTMNVPTETNRMFDVYDSAVGCCGEVPSIFLQTDGSYLVVVKSQDQTTLIVNLWIIGNKLVFYILHKTLNLTREVVYCIDLLRYLEEVL